MPALPDLHQGSRKPTVGCMELEQGCGGQGPHTQSPKPGLLHAAGAASSSFVWFFGGTKQNIPTILLFSINTTLKDRHTLTRLPNTSLWSWVNRPNRSPKTLQRKSLRHSVVFTNFSWGELTSELLNTQGTWPLVTKSQKSVLKISSMQLE